MAIGTVGGDSDSIRSMTKLQIRSIEPPLDDPEATDAAFDVLKAMEAMGLLPEDVEELSLDLVRSVVSWAAEAGIGESAAASLRSRTRLTSSYIATVLRELEVALEGSPAPAFEWPAMVELFGAERLSELVGISVASLRRSVVERRGQADV